MKKFDSTYLVTGAAGFIGAALVHKLLKKGKKVIGIDNLNKYYDQNLKKSRLNYINQKNKLYSGDWKFYQVSIQDKNSLNKIAQENTINTIIHLAAQAGVRYSIENPEIYIDSNIVGFMNILELCRHFDVKHLIFASSSSVYGGNKNIPYEESHNVDFPVSLYAATKKSNELMAHSYSYLFNIPMTGLRLFTVYGPWGRPDMAPFIFTKAILSSTPINVFNKGNVSRDFTFIDDIVDAICGCCDKPSTSLKINNSSNVNPPYRIFNVGNSNPINILSFIDLLENELGKKAIKNFKDMQLGDMFKTHADTTKLKDWLGFEPKISLEVGIKKFVSWYRNYYKI